MFDIRFDGASYEDCRPCARRRFGPGYDARESKAFGENGVNNSSKELQMRKFPSIECSNETVIQTFSLFPNCQMPQIFPYVEINPNQDPLKTSYHHSYSLLERDILVEII